MYIWQDGLLLCDPDRFGDKIAMYVYMYIYIYIYIYYPLCITYYILPIVRPFILNAHMFSHDGYEPWSRAHIHYG